MHASERLPAHRRIASPVRHAGRGQLALLAGLALLATAACAPAAAQQPTPAPQPAALPAEAPPRTVSVTGQGEATATPDRARLLFWVETRAQTAAAAAQENATRMERVIAALRSAGIEQRDIQTTGYSLTPDYRYIPQTEERQLRGYVARNGVQVHVRDIARVGRLIDTAIGAGANMVGDLSFESSRAPELRREALADAVTQACRDAQAIAGAAGLQLARVLDMTSGYQMMPPPGPRMMADAVRMEAAAAPTPIQPGELSLNAVVSIRYELGTSSGVTCR